MPSSASRFLSLRFGWKAWLAMFVVLGVVNVVAWYLPGSWGIDRPPMLVPSALVFLIWWLHRVLLLVVGVLFLLRLARTGGARR